MISSNSQKAMTLKRYELFIFLFKNLSFLILLSFYDKSVATISNNKAKKDHSWMYQFPPPPQKKKKIAIVSRAVCAQKFEWVRSNEPIFRQFPAPGQPRPT